MIARESEFLNNPDVWSKLAAPLLPTDISWRIDSNPKEREGKYYARFVCYIEAGTVRERLDSTVPGEWDLTLDALPQYATAGGEIDPDSAFAFKARLQILGVIREDVGTGKNYKEAATDAFKRVAVRFGIGHELYSFEQNWVETDSKGKPVIDPQTAYEQRYGLNKALPQPGTPSTPPVSTLTDMTLVSCPQCGGRMFDNRLTKKNPKAPDYKCQNRNCKGVIWPEKASA